MKRLTGGLNTEVLQGKRPSVRFKRRCLLPFKAEHGLRSGRD